MQGLSFPGRLSEIVFEYLLCGRVILNSRANQSLSDREITYLLRDIDRKRDTADMRSEAKQREEREETEKKTRKQRKGFP